MRITRTFRLGEWDIETMWRIWEEIRDNNEDPLRLPRYVSGWMGTVGGNKVIRKPEMMEDGQRTLGCEITRNGEEYNVTFILGGE